MSERRRELPRVRIESWSDADMDLLRSSNSPEMTAHLGGPESEAELLDRHQRYLAIAGKGTGRMFRVALESTGEAVGIVGYWDRNGEDVYEAGWSVLPAFQGKGIAAAAVTAVLDSARNDAQHRYLHAFPSVDNASSNALCARLGFSFIAEHDFEYPVGHMMRCNDWRFDLTAAK